MTVLLASMDVVQGRAQESATSPEAPPAMEAPADAPAMQGPAMEPPVMDAPADGNGMHAAGERDSSTSPARFAVQQAEATLAAAKDKARDARKAYAIVRRELRQAQAREAAARQTQQTVEQEIKQAEKGSTAGNEVRDARKAYSAARRDLQSALSREAAGRRAQQAAELELQRAEKGLREARAVAEVYQRRLPEESDERRAAEIEAGRRTAEWIDATFAAEWKKSGVVPAAIIDDAGFYRRASLDLTGAIPTSEQMREFVADRRPDKRALAVERLLSDPRLADYWALRFRSWILDVAPVVGQGANTVKLFEYLREAVALGMPYDAVVKELLTAEGHNANDGAVSFVMLWEAKPAELAAACSRLFMGVNLQCAQCHDDMIDGWTQEDFWGMAAFFTGLESRYNNKPDSYPSRPRSPLSATHFIGGIQAVPGEFGETRVIVHTRDVPVIIPHPTDLSKRKLMPPKPLLGDRMTSIPDGRRRHVLAAWLARPDNPYLNRTIVNRVWMQFFGRGFAPTPDGFQPSAEIDHEELLAALSNDFLQQHRSLKHLMRSIVLSRLYQLSAGPQAPPPGDYSRQTLRRLDVDQWYDSILRATGMEERISREANAKRDKRFVQELRWHRQGAVQTTGPTSGALLEMNGFLSQRAVEEGATIDRALTLPRSRRLEELFWSTIGRAPTPEEAAVFRPDFDEADPRSALADCLWTLVNSTEFVTH